MPGRCIIVKAYAGPPASMDRPAGKGIAPQVAREVMSKLRTHNDRLTMGLAEVCHSPGEGSWLRVLT